MINYVLVGIGGAFGSLARYGLGRMIAKRVKTFFPLATFLINISGAILLGIISSIQLNSNIYTLLADGFLGAYTTFSAFMFEGFDLFRGNKKLNASVYIAGSIIIGIIVFILGMQIGRSF